MFLRLRRTGLCPDPEFIALSFPGRRARSRAREKRRSAPPSRQISHRRSCRCRVDGRHCCRRPSQNRTCGFPAYGSSEGLKWSPYVHADMRERNEPLPQTLELMPVPSVALAPPRQHLVGCCLHVVPEGSNGVKVSIDPIISAMASGYRRHAFQNLRHGHLPDFTVKPFLRRLPLHFQFLPAGSDAQSILPVPRCCIEEGKSQKIKVFCEFRPMSTTCTEK